MPPASCLPLAAVGNIFQLPAVNFFLDIVRSPERSVGRDPRTPHTPRVGLADSPHHTTPVGLADSTHPTLSMWYGFSHHFRQPANVTQEGGILVGQEGLGPIRQGLLGTAMHFDMNAVGAGGHR